MKFSVQATYNGFRLSMLNDSGQVRHHFDEVGGHGPIEKLYAQIDLLWDELRARELQARAGYTPRSGFDPRAVKAALEQALEVEPGDGIVEVGPSNVTLSPHDYVFVWLTSERHEGPHAIVSDLREYENRDGYLVGVYADFESGADSVECRTLEEAVAKTRELIKLVTTRGTPAPGDRPAA